MRRITGRLQRPESGHGSGIAAARSPSVSKEFLVLQVDGPAFRAAHLRRRERGLESLGLEHGELEGCLEFLRSRCARNESAHRRVVLVTPEAQLTVQGSSFEARMSCVDRARWTRALDAQGLELSAIYPLAGSPLGALDEEGQTVLCVQVEREVIAVMELVRGRCAQLESFPREEPTSRRVQELVGEACPEVLLCGGGADLSELGYELACGGSTWVSILRPRSLPLSEPDQAAIVGAVRHACGLVPADRLACLTSARSAG